MYPTPHLFWPAESQAKLNDLKVVIENAFGSVYQLLTIGVIIFALSIAFSKKGKYRFGKE